MRRRSELQCLSLLLVMTMTAACEKGAAPAKTAPLMIQEQGSFAVGGTVVTNPGTSFAVALDPSGKLAWKASSIDGDHVVTVLSERVSDVYLAFLRSKGVSYVFGGKAEVNLKLVLGKLRRLFGIRTLLLEGGGKINGSFLDANLIDELSVLVAPIADGSVGTPSLFDSRWGTGPARPLKLVSVRKLRGDLLWLRYEVRG
jgi:2,5-diamino-6-(ribosylamino)-4(3H)-pyrimidinone 5'-phosphate reductase